MTKRDHRIKQRLAPLGDDGVAAMRHIVERHQAIKVNETLVDAFSASAFVQVHDALNPKNQKHLRGLCIGKAMDLVWRLVGRSKKKS